MKQLALSAGLAALAAVASAAPTPGKGRTAIDQAEWLAGAWVAETGSGWTEERWAPPRGGVMLGTSLSGRGAAASSYDFMRIAVDAEGSLTFWGSPEGRPAVAFRLAAAGPDRLTFANPSHDYPTQISYRRDGERLIATISGPNGANPMSWRYRRR